MSDYRSNVDNPPPRRVVVPIKTGRIGTDQLFPDRNVIGHNKDAEGKTGPIEFVKLPEKVGKPLIDDEDYVKAMKLVIQNPELSEGVLTKNADAVVRSNFVKNASQKITDEGNPTKGDQVFKMGFEMLREHYEEAEDGAGPLGVIDGILEANKDRALPSGKVDVAWFDDMLGNTPKT